MTRYTWLTAALFACTITACGPMDPAEGLHDDEIGSLQQGLYTRYLPFSYGNTSGVAGPVRGKRYGVVDGLLGWKGNPICLWGGCVDGTAFYVSNGGSASRYGSANLYFQYLTIPETGYYRIRSTTSKLRVKGSTTVKGRGWAFSSIDARASVYVTMRADLDYWTEVFYARPRVAADATKSESRTKSFDTSLSLPQDVSFYAKRGQKLRFYVTADLSTWANGDGSAEIKIRRFGIPAVDADKLITIVR